jgi:glucans biosynthesis protein
MAAQRRNAAQLPANVTRRAFVAGAGAIPFAAALASPAGAQEATQPFGRPAVIEIARELAAAPFVAPSPSVPEPLIGLSFPDYSAIQARPETWLFTQPPSGFGVEPLHSGFIYREPVELYVVENGQPRKLAFDPANFVYPPVEGLPLDAPLEFAGFRGRSALNAPDRLDTFIVFAGASYFQAVARGQVFGLSARGLAIGTGDPQGEEFPFFHTFWLEPPMDGRMVVHALLDSPSVTGAYRFTIRPGDETQIDVEAILFARAEITRLGLAPLTSMYLFGALSRAGYDDVRAAVHDSDGLAIWNGKDERIWRPLANPRLLQISAFADSGPRGFGLIQREKRFAEYEDLEAQYHRRPSLWVEPIGDWGPGDVILVEIPSDRDIHDNIVAFWRPEAPLPAGGETTITYRLTWGWDAPNPQGLMRVVRTLSGADARAGWRRFVVDFADLSVQGQPSTQGLTANVRSSAGVVEGVELRENPAISGVRLEFDLNTEGADSIDLRAELLRDGRPAGEVWVFRWTS